MNLKGRALHYVFKIGNRTKSIEFFINLLGMKVLRHEEFKEGCEAQCNGPYDDRWSKTMVGYGIEDTHFVLELTYNYNVSSYDFGNDFSGITIRSKEAIENAKKLNWPLEKQGSVFVLKSPDGYPFYLVNELQESDKDPIQKITLSSSNLEKSVQYWNEILGLRIVDRSETSVSLYFDESQVELEFKNIGTAVDHKTAFGRIAFSIPENELKIVDETIKKTNNKILTPLVSLDTPGKATVIVIILADPDGHEICFVGDEGFRQLATFDPEGSKLLQRYIKKDEERQK